MSKEYLDAFKNLKQELYYSPNQIPDIDKWHETIEQALQRLNAIDNAEPSEAVKCLEELGEMYYVEADNLEESVITYANECDWFNTIKQALLKSQEPKHYLKWEDLRFVYGEWNKLEVYLGNEKLGISYKSDFDFFDNRYEVVKIYNLKTKSRICKIYDGDKQFFNDLHLERVE